MIHNKFLIIIPTYNERDNVCVIIENIFKSLGNEVDILIVDGNSTDGTKDAVLKLKKRNIYLISQKEKNGLGGAYKEGYAFAVKHDYEYIVQMDCDGSHPVKYIKPMLEKLKDNYDVIIGSRWVDSSMFVDMPNSRKLLSRGANYYIKLMFNWGLYDSTSGFKAINKKAAKILNSHDVASSGFSFQIEYLLLMHKNNMKIYELPIEFHARLSGESKMNFGIIWEACVNVMKWSIEYRNNKTK